MNRNTCATHISRFIMHQIDIDIAALKAATVLVLIYKRTFSYSVISVV